MKRGMVALALAIVDIGGYAVLSVIVLLNFGPELADPVSTVMFGAVVAAFSLMGALLIRRVPENRIGALLLATGTAQTASIAVLTYAGLGGLAVPPWPVAAIAATFGDAAYIAPWVIALIGVPLVFPDGRLPSRRFRWVVWVTGAGMVSLLLGAPASMIPGLADLGPVVSALALVANVFGLGGAVAAVWVRFRRGDPVQRQQVKWLLAVAGVATIAFPSALAFGSSESFVSLAFWLVAFLAYLALPVAIGIAVLRYRLYEIDRIISRTIGYAVVTVTLAVTFGGAILLFQAVLAPLTGGNTLAVAASTLVAAALFQPLRRRVQTVVDRRFNRAGYDAERTAAAFAAQLRDEVDLRNLSGDVLQVVAQTVAPATVALWLRRSEVEP
jgi:MFS family permease